MKGMERRANPGSRLGRYIKDWPDPCTMVHACAVMQCSPAVPQEEKGCDTCNYGPNGLIPICEEVDKIISEVERELINERKSDE
jgi:hypothetical protein